ncbi:MAG: hypothetical protein U5P41_15595 [Gammaproteobacteria bacterium]|nr:hypothetical protein [Gammaproteobacteria bacterium]
MSLCQVSAETIYSYLYVLPRGELRRELLSHLRQHRKNHAAAVAGPTGAARRLR